MQLHYVHAQAQSPGEGIGTPPVQHTPGEWQREVV